MSLVSELTEDEEEKKEAEMSETKQSDGAVKIADAVKDFEAVVRISEKAAVAPMIHASMGLTKQALAELYCDALTSLYEAITNAGIDMGSVMPKPPSILKKLRHEIP